MGKGGGGARTEGHAAQIHAAAERRGTRAGNSLGARGAERLCGKARRRSGEAPVRRLTSGEYAYTIKDLTGLDLNVGIGSSSDSVGGEGFDHFGAVRFMQDANLERYLAAAKIVAGHAVIGPGHSNFWSPGKSGFAFGHYSDRRDIYAANGFRTVSGEGGNRSDWKIWQGVVRSWQYKHRAVLGQLNATLPALAAREVSRPSPRSAHLAGDE